MWGSRYHLADLITPVVGQSSSHVRNSQHFAEKMRESHVDDTEQLRSYDVKSLFTSVPVDKAIELVEKKLRQDPTLTDRTNMNPSDIAKLLTICLNCTYFVFDGQFYPQIHGAPMGSPVSPLVCNLYMEAFEESAISTAPIPPGWWLRYVDDTYCKITSSDADESTQHLNSVDPNIQVTTETESNGELTFLDTCTVRRMMAH